MPRPREGHHLPQVTQQAWPLTPAYLQAWLSLLTASSCATHSPPSSLQEGAVSGVGDPRKNEQAGGGRVFTLLQGPPWGLVGSSGLGRLNMEGSEGFQVLPGPWGPSHQASSPG